MRYLTPGPTQLHPAVPPALARALENDVCSISHRSEAFQTIYRRAEEGVRTTLSVPSDWQVFFLASATEAMERIVQNCVTRESFHFVNGAFSERFYKTALQLGREVRSKQCPLGGGYCVEDTSEVRGAELITLALNETATGVYTPASDLAHLRRANPDALIALDMVSAVPYATVEFSHIDLAFFSTQKGFGLPSGLGVLLVSPRALSVAAARKASGESLGSFRSFVTMLEYAQKRHTLETPNVLGLYLLGEVAEALDSYGLARIRRETEDKAALLYGALSELGFEPFVRDPALRSVTMIVMKTKEGEAKEILEQARRAGIVLGSGYGALKDHAVRIANFPMHTKEDTERVVRVLEAVRHTPSTSQAASQTLDSVGVSA